MLAPGETLVAVAETDLDERLRFATGAVALTNRRLLSRTNDNDAWREWPIDASMELRLRDHAGAGSLDLFASESLLARWRFTLGRLPAAQKVVERFAEVRRDPEAGTSAVEPALPVCEKCGADLAPDDEECPRCGAEAESPPSPRNLFRLWRFAQPYRARLALGFVLTLGATAATLVPPYLTMPLMDRVLIPYGKGVPIDVGLVAMLLAALFASVFAAWGLGWARTYVLALVSERIGADLRTTTYEHLLRFVARILRWPAHRRSHVAHRLRDRPHLPVPVAAPARLRDGRADDRDDRGHPHLDRSVAGDGDAPAAAVHRVDDPPRARPSSSWLREGGPRVGAR